MKKLPQEIIENILEYCDWETIKSCRDLQSDHFIKKTETNDINKAILKDNLNNVKWLIQRGKEFNYNSLFLAFYKKNADIIKYILNNNYEIEGIAVYIMIINDIDMIELLLNNYKSCNFKILYSLAICFKCLDTIKFLKNKNIQFASDMLLTCTLFDNFNILKWLVENGYEYTNEELQICLLSTCNLRTKSYIDSLFR